MICYFCFYKISNGVQSRLAFSKTFKHCNIITFDGITWLAHEFDREGFKTQEIDVYTGGSLIRGVKYIESLIALIVVEVHERAAIVWKPFIVRSCNEIGRYISGVDVGFTFNPKHLYNKLLKHNGTNYNILHVWERQ